LANFSWTYDGPTGTYKNQALSSKLYEQAIAECSFMDFVKPISAFGKSMGESVTLTRVRQLSEPTNARLSENERIPEDTLALSTTTITVKEWGRSVPFNSLAEDLSKFDVENTIQMTLKNQLKLVLDSAACAAFKTAKVKYTPTGAATNNISTSGVAGASATANINAFHLEQIRDYLYDTLLAPPASGDDYIGIFRALAIRGLKNDSNWLEWHKYTDPQAKFNGEAGRWESIRLIETNHANALGKIGTGSVLGEGIVFGADAVAMAESMTPELRAKSPEDYGRSKGVAWYGQFEFGIIWDTAAAGEAKIVHVASL
jgi:N4-gp56 family major capsid protein